MGWREGGRTEAITTRERIEILGDTFALGLKGLKLKRDTYRYS